MEKLTLHELREMKNWEHAVIVITADSFNKEYTLEERSYVVHHSCPYFNNGTTISKRLSGNCLDGKDMGVRLDWYIGAGWNVDYCYIES